MSLSPEDRLGPYEIVAAIGAGGMGEVYRATDTRLDRQVAIKVLPAQLAQDKERLARFGREAKLLASLNHPNIAAIFGMEVGAPLVGARGEDRERAGTRPAPTEPMVALVMELVEGEDLAERLRRGAIPVDEAIAVAKQIAEGLEEAHEHGIIHRDLKPANIKLTPDGKVKILDFGLAKALESDSASSAANAQLSQSPTISRHMTEAGMIMGTAAYMSPEQARGKPVDKRADIWAFGVVLFEMLTGRRLFGGDTVTDTLAAVLTRDPDFGSLPAQTPTGVRQLLRRCLERNPRNRLHDIADGRIVLAEAAAGEAQDSVMARGSKAKLRAAAFGTILPWGAGLVAGVLISALAAWSLGFGKSARSESRFRAVTSFAGAQIQPSLSPDGRSVAFVSNRDGDYDIYVSLISGGTLIRITHDPNVESRPTWSPDGASIAYSRLNEWGLWDIWQVPALGGTPRRLVLNAADPAFSRDGRSLAYANAATRTIWISDPTGQNPRALTSTEPLTGEAGFYGLHDAEPRFSPDGLELVFVTRAGGPYGEVRVVDLASGKARELTHDGALAFSPSWSADGRHVYFASSRGGTMNIWRIAARGGDPEQITAGQGDDVQPDASQDGRRVVFSTYREKLGFARLDLGARPDPQNPKQIVIDAARNQVGPVWAPDGTRLAYFSNFKGVEREGIWAVSADGTEPVALVQDGWVNIFPRWSADGGSLVYKTEPPGLGARGEFRRVSVAGGAPTTLVRDVTDGNFDLGTDGRLLFRKGGSSVASYDPSTGKSQDLSLSGLSERGWLLRWSPDGDSIAYTIPPSRETDPEAGLWVEDLHANPRQVFRGWVTWYARGPDRQIFLQEGKPDLKSVLWRVGWDGSGLTRIATVPLVYSYWAGAKGLAQNYIDVSPDGRHVVFGSLEVLQANIGMIENSEAGRPWTF